jgi:hypothetical protein
MTDPFIGHAGEQEIRERSVPAAPTGDSAVALPSGGFEQPSGEFGGPTDPWASVDHEQSEGAGYEEPADWAWVEEWREGGEPVPWGPGLAVSAFTAVLVAVAVYVLSSGLADQPLVDIGVNVLVTGGLAPALWLSRTLPVLRWISGGAVLGVLAAWFAVFVFLG